MKVSTAVFAEMHNVRRLARAWQRAESVCRVRYAVHIATGARFAETCTGELIDAAGSLALTGDVVQNESEGQLALAALWLRCLRTSSTCTSTHAI